MQLLAANRAGTIEEAVALYQQVLARDPRNKFAHYNLGLIEQVSERTAAAEASYRQALSTDPSYVLALFNLGVVRAAMGACAEAITLCRAVEAVEPLHAPAHFNLGYELWMGNELGEGEAELKRAAALDPTLAVRARNTM